MVDDRELEEANPGETKEKSDGSEKLLSRMRRWVLERLKAFPPKIDEARARLLIVKETREDLKTADQGRMSRKRARVRAEVESLGITEDKPLSKIKTDSITGGEFVVTIRREPGAWVAEETTMAGDIISQARVSDGGSTELTLHFRGERYEENDADPNLTVDCRFPSATLTTMELLVRTFK